MLQGPMSKLPANRAKLPATYESARGALEKCVKIDECSEWANRAAALASYAKQANDESLYKMAVRIKARAIRRAGELLKQIEAKQGARTDIEPRIAGGTRSQAAREAGLSKRQKENALRMASVPRDDFERSVESDKPATITALAKAGTKPRPRPFIDPDLFALSTEAQAGIGWLYRVTKIDPKKVAHGSTARERAEIEKRARKCIDWLKTLLQELRRIRR